MKITGMIEEIVLVNNLIRNAYPLADCEPTPAAPCKQGWSCKSKKDVNPMSTSYATATLVAQEDTTAKDQRRYLISELYDSFSAAKLALKRKFGLADDETPHTLADAVKRIQDGLFIIPDKYKDRDSFGLLSYLRWRDPKAVEDKAGYEAAKAPLKALLTKTEREIRIFSPEKGLQAVVDFEAAAAK